MDSDWNSGAVSHSLKGSRTLALTFGRERTSTDSTGQPNNGLTIRAKLWTDKKTVDFDQNVTGKGALFV